MGMDVYGKNPTAPEGEYFRNNVWWWHPLAEYVQDVAPEEAGRCRHWHSNSGDGLDAEGAVALAKVLRAEIESGATAKFAAERAAELDAIDDTQCGLCAGTGIRTDAVGVDLNMPSKTVPETDVDGRPNPRAGQTGWCNGCSGRGSRRPAEAQYPFDVENVAEFVSFLEACGGFEIC